MKILHISDFHYTTNTKSMFDQNKIIENICLTLKNKVKIDFIIFSGDLLKTGMEYEDFLEAHNLIFVNLRKELNVPFENMFICAGNHEHFRGKELGMIKSVFSDSIKSNEDLELFISDSEQLERSFDNLINYVKYEEHFYQNHLLIGDIKSRFYTISNRNIENNKISIVGINSAWRHISDDTSNKLVYPISELKYILSLIEKSDFKILFMHHQLQDFMKWQSDELEDLIYQNFHMLLNGHVHKKRHKIIMELNNCILINTSPASLTLKDSSQVNGFTIIDFNLNTFDFFTSVFKYDKIDSIYTETKSDVQHLQSNETRNKIHELSRRVNDIRASEIEKAEDLFLIIGDDKKDRMFSVFQSPIIKNKSKIEVSGGANNVITIPYSDLLKESDKVLVLGDSKSGKTVLFKRIYIDYLSEFGSSQRLPIYFDLKYSGQRIKTCADIERQIKIVYGRKISEISSLFERLEVIVILENIQYLNYEEVRQIVKIVSDSKYKLLMSGNENDLMYDVKEYQSIFKINIYYIHDLTKHLIKNLTLQSSIDITNADKLIESLMKTFRQLHIPFNFWMVSIFIFIGTKNRTHLKNSVDLIELLIEEILEKNKLALSRGSNIDYENFKIILSDFALFLYKNHEKDNYSATQREILEFLEDYFTTNVRYNLGAEAVLDYLIKKNIIYKNELSKYTIRLLGVFEYLLAIQIKNSGEFRDFVIAEQKRLISFKNELEIYAGLVKKDVETLEVIRKHVKNVFQSTIKVALNNEQYDKHFLAKVKGNSEYVDKIESEMNNYSDDSNYSIDEELEISKINVEKKVYLVNEEEVKRNIVNYYTLLGRYFRNSDQIKSTVYELELFEELVNYSIELGINYIDILKKEDRDQVGYIEKHAEIVKLLNSILPIVCQSLLLDAIGHPNMLKLIDKSINKCKSDYKNNQVKLFILYLLKIDITSKLDQKVIDEMLEYIQWPILRRTMIAKMFYYLVLKYNKDDATKELIIRVIIKINKKLDKNFDEPAFKKDISRRLRQSIRLN